MPWQKTFDVAETLDKAMQTFWAQGYEATSMQDLVERTGVNRGSLYATYGDKRALFLAALRMYDDRMRDNLLRRVEAAHDPRDAVRQVFLRFSEVNPESGVNCGCFITNTALELAPHDADVCRIVAQAQRRIEAFFRRMIEDGKAQGTITAELDAGETARGLLASMIGIAVLTRSRPERDLLNGVVEEAMRRLG